MVTGNAMGSRYLTDLSCGIDQTHLYAKSACTSSKGCDSVSINHMTIQEEDIRFLIADGTKKKKRMSRIAGGGLRQFSLIVCRKVETKGRTTYSEVADEIIAECAALDVNPVPLNEFDEKNVRRRVYDALNVLMAMDIIAKDKKEIQWKGFPRMNTNDAEELQAVRLKLMSRIKKKATYLQELEEQIAGLQHLMLRNQQLHKSETIPAEGVCLPFILVRTCPEATVEIEIAEDMRLVHFDFNGTPFALHDDVYILKAMRYCRDPDHRHISENSLAQLSSSHSSTSESFDATPFSWNSEFSTI